MVVPLVELHPTEHHPRSTRADIPLTTPLRLALALLCAAAAACARPASTDTAADAAGIDSLNARLSRAYRDRDPALYSTLWTDSGAFEWAATPTVRGPTALGEMARGIWAGERDVELRVRPGTRRIAGDHATEFGAFEQAWTDSAGKRSTEYGRYVTYLLRQPDGSWRMDRFFGFEDSVRPAPRPPAS
jgi:hypothetical protein